jgi:hypothetical protein
MASYLFRQRAVADTARFVRVNARRVALPTAEVSVSAAWWTAMLRSQLN